MFRSRDECSHCQAKIEDALLKADGGAELDFDTDARGLGRQRARGSGGPRYDQERGV